MKECGFFCGDGGGRALRMMISASLKTASPTIV